MEESIQRFWERVYGYVTENKVDARWILREDNDSRAYGSLRIVSHPDLKPGYMRAYASFVTKRRPKSKKEIAEAVENYQMHETELEVYSVNENIETTETTYEDRYQDLEKMFGVKIFGK